MPPRVALIGSEFEENLSLRYLAAATAQDGCESVLIPFNDENRANDIVREVLALRPLVVGISIPFQLRARESLALAERIRAAGSDAHITLGGHFATFEYESILRHYPAVDSIVRHEGEATLRELCQRRSAVSTRGPTTPTARATADGGRAHSRRDAE